MKINSNLYINVLPVVYRAPTRTLVTNGWKNAIATHTLDYLPSADVRNLSALYTEVDGWGALQKEEAKAAAILTPLGFDRPLGEAGRLQMLQALAEVDRINSLMAIDSSQIIEALRELHLRFPPAQTEAMRREIFGEQKAARGSCVTDMPINLG